MKTLFIADPHFGHANIMRHSKRNFTSVEEMDEVMIKNWNSVVSNDDHIWILGDFCYKSGRSPLDYLKALNGAKHFIVGNHDSHLLNQTPCRRLLESIDQIKSIEVDKKRIILCHYPMVEWEGYFRGALHFYGHIHNNVENDAYKIMKHVKGAYNAGADILGLMPRTASEVIICNEEFWKNN